MLVRVQQKKVVELQRTIWATFSKGKKEVRVKHADLEENPK